MQESRLKWYRHVLRREDKRVTVMEEPGERRRDRSGGGWITSGTTCRWENCQGRKRKTEFNGGAPYLESSTPHKSGKGWGRRRKERYVYNTKLCAQCSPTMSCVYGWTANIHYKQYNMMRKCQTTPVHVRTRCPSMAQVGNWSWIVIQLTLLKNLSRIWRIVQTPSTMFSYLLNNNMYIKACFC